MRLIFRAIANVAKFIILPSWTKNFEIKNFSECFSVFFLWEPEGEKFKSAFKCFSWWLSVVLIMCYTEKHWGRTELHGEEWNRMNIANDFVVWNALDHPHFHVFNQMYLNVVYLRVYDFSDLPLPKLLPLSGKGFSRIAHDFSKTNFNTLPYLYFNFIV